MNENNVKVTATISGGGLTGDYLQMWPTQQHGICPSCGRCRCCGKQETYTYPYWPPNYPTYNERYLGPTKEDALIWQKEFESKLKEVNKSLERDVTPSEKKDGEGTKGS